MKRTLLLILTIQSLAWTSLAAGAEKYLPKSIQFKGTAEYSSWELLAGAGLKMDTYISYAEMQASSQRLLDTGLFESASFTYKGSDLIFNLVPSRVLYPVRLENLPLTPGKALDAALHDRLPLYHGKVPYDAGLTEQVRQALQELLAAKGIQATVTAAPYTDLKRVEVTAMSFSVTVPTVQVGEIHLEGVAPDLLEKAKLVADHARMAGYDTVNSVANIELAFASFFSEEGYAAAKVHVEQLGNVEASSDEIDVPFKVTVELGRHYKLGSVHLPSGELLTLEKINSSAGVVSNNVENLSVKGGLTLRTALQFVTGECKSKGHVECVVTPHPQYDDANGIVSYTFDVQPGPVYTMGRLTIENGTDDLRDAMLAAWKMPTGALFNEGAIKTYFYTQGNTALGRTFASAICRYKLYTNHETHIVDVTLRLERKQ